MDETDRYEEDYGAIGSLIGPGSHLEGDRLNELLALISIELMRRATKAGLEDEGARALRQVLLLWMRKLHSTPYNPRRLEFFVSEFSDPDRKRVERGLELLSQCLPMVQKNGWASEIVVDLSPWLRDNDDALIADLHRQWLSQHIRAVQHACHGAELMIENYLDPRLPQSSRPGVRARLTLLQERWTALKRRLRLTRRAHLREALADPWALYDEVAELEHLHDCVIGLQADPDGTPMLFSMLWRLEGPSKLQALSLSRLETGKTEREPRRRSSGLVH